MKSWLTYCLLLVFAVYWASNLFLWYPWSFDPTLGITLMLTVAPLAWAYTISLALRTYPGEHLMRGAGYITMVFLPVAVLLDFVFFGLVRQAMEELYHPSTLYGYAFLLVLPFFVAWILKKRISSRKRQAKATDKIKALAVGSCCLLALILIIAFDIKYQ